MQLLPSASASVSWTVPEAARTTPAVFDGQAAKD
jgi:hypothetical protein